MKTILIRTTQSKKEILAMKIPKSNTRRMQLNAKLRWKNQWTWQRTLSDKFRGIKQAQRPHLYGPNLYLLLTN